jgi:transposase
MGWNARVLANFTMENSREGFNLLVGRVKKWRERIGAEAVLFGCEPAGHYWRPLAYFLKDEGLSFRLVSPFTVRRYREGIDLARNKNDRQDAAMIAELLRTGRSLEPRSSQGVYADLKHTYRSYRRVRAERTRHYNLLIGMIDLLFPEYHRVFKDLTGKSSLAVLHFCPVPSKIQEMSLNGCLV